MYFLVLKYTNNNITIQETQKFRVESIKYCKKLLLCIVFRKKFELFE